MIAPKDMGAPKDRGSPRTTFDERTPALMLGSAPNRSSGPTREQLAGIVASGNAAMMRGRFMRSLVGVHLGELTQPAVLGSSPSVGSGPCSARSRLDRRVTLVVSTQIPRCTAGLARERRDLVMAHPRFGLHRSGLVATCVHGLRRHLPIRRHGAPDEIGRSPSGPGCGAMDAGRYQRRRPRRVSPRRERPDVTIGSCPEAGGSSGDHDGPETTATRTLLPSQRSEAGQ